jgi:threonine/homoserine/homoserine lactone efflux protein
MLPAVLFGFLLSFAGSIPAAGPVAVLVIANAADRKFRAAALLVAGAAVAEAPYACLAFAGMGALITRHAAIGPVAGAVAAVLLVSLGLVFALRKRRGDAPAAEDRASVGHFVLGFSISILNPTLVVTWTAASTTLFSFGLVPSDPILALPFAVGVTLGTLAWAALLLGLARRYGSLVPRRTLDGVVRAMGVVLVGVGLAFFVPLVRYLHHAVTVHAATIPMR